MAIQFDNIRRILKDKYILYVIVSGIYSVALYLSLRLNDAIIDKTWLYITHYFYKSGSINPTELYNNFIIFCQSVELSEQKECVWQIYDKINISSYLYPLFSILVAFLSLFSDSLNFSTIYYIAIIFIYIFIFNIFILGQKSNDSKAELFSFVIIIFLSQRILYLFSSWFPACLNQYDIFTMVPRGASLLALIIAIYFQISKNYVLSGILYLCSMLIHMQFIFFNVIIAIALFGGDFISKSKKYFFDRLALVLIPIFFIFNIFEYYNENYYRFNSVINISKYILFLSMALFILRKINKSINLYISVVILYSFTTLVYFLIVIGTKIANYYDAFNLYQHGDISLFIFGVLRALSQGFPRFEAVIINVTIAIVSYVVYKDFLADFIATKIKNSIALKKNVSALGLFFVINLIIISVISIRFINLKNDLSLGGSLYERFYSDAYLKLTNTKNIK